MRRALPLLALVHGCGVGSGAEGEAPFGGPYSLSCVPNVFFEDLDGDGFGVGTRGVPGSSCRPPAHHAERNGDCDDRSSGVHPNAAEICDGRDNDCDGLVDDADPEVVGRTRWARDADGDGYGTDELVAEACEAPAHTASVLGDCDDANSGAHPGIAEDTTDGFDNNCDGLVDVRGLLTGTWSRADGGGGWAGEGECAEEWVVEATWRPMVCPDCDLSFWVSDDEHEWTGSGRRACRLPEAAFGIGALADEAGELYLVFIFEQESGSSYYSYYGYYGYSEDIPIEPYYLQRFPEVPVAWDGTTLAFEWGPSGVPASLDDGRFEPADAEVFGATVE